MRIGKKKELLGRQRSLFKRLRNKKATLKGSTIPRLFSTGREEGKRRPGRRRARSNVQEGA